MIAAPEAPATVQAHASTSSAERLEHDQMTTEYARLRERVLAMELHIRKSEERRKALLHLIQDFNAANKRLEQQRKAMLHVLGDYELDRRRLGEQADRLDNSRRALLHILQDSHRSKLRLEESRKAMIHIMGDLRDTTEEIQRRESELREKQEQLVQAGKLATLGELTTGVAHELNNPLNNIGLYVGNVMDIIQLGNLDTQRMLRDLNNALAQVHKATQIISHLRTFGRAAPASQEPVAVRPIIQQSLSLLHEQLRLRSIETRLDLGAHDPVVMGNAIQLEQVFLNLLTNARDALEEADRKRIAVSLRVEDETITIVFRDTGPGIPRGLERRVFDPFFTTKQVGAGTGLGLSIAYGIVRDHHGRIFVENARGNGAVFVVKLPIARESSDAQG
jgi:C4-dicarboxylate-specific signal transduction histidine kinase